MIWRTFPKTLQRCRCDSKTQGCTLKVIKSGKLSVIINYLGIEFYWFVSHGGMNDRGSTCKFRNARSAFWNLHVDSLSFITPWETNNLIFILYQNCPVLAIKYPFLNTQQVGIQNSRRNSRLKIRHGNSFMEKWMSKFIVAENTGSVNILTSELPYS